MIADMKEAEETDEDQDHAQEVEGQEAKIEKGGQGHDQKTEAKSEDPEVDPKKDQGHQERGSHTNIGMYLHKELNT